MKILVTCEMNVTFIEGLKSLQYEVDYFPYIENYEVETIIQEYDGIVISTKIILNKEKIEKGKKLKFIARAGSGLENIDIKYAVFRHIKCISSPEGNKNAVAEHALGMILNLFNNISTSFEEIKQEKWLREENRGIELDGKTIGIIGYGNTGSAFAKKLSGFDVEVLVYDKYLKNIENHGVKQVEMDSIFKNADLVSLHLPLTEETKFMVNHGFLEMFKKSIFLVNTSRGKIINTKELIQALKSGKVKGACLDVLEDEGINKGFGEKNLWFTELIQFKNVILTPHTAGWTHESKEKIGKVLLEKIKLIA